MLNKKIIFGIFILLLTLTMVQSQIVNFTGYRSGKVTDIPKFITLYEKGFNKGGWCRQQAMSSVQVYQEYQRLKDKYGSNLIINGYFVDGNLKSVVIAWVDGDTVFFKSVMWDWDIPKNQWLRLLDKHSREVLRIAKTKGATKLSTVITNDTYVGNYVIKVLFNNGGWIENGVYYINATDYENINVDYSRRLNYTPPPSQNQGDKGSRIPSNAVQLNPTTWKVGEHSTYFIYPSDDIYLVEDNDNYGVGGWHRKYDLSAVEGNILEAWENFTAYDVNANSLTGKTREYNMSYWNETMNISEFCNARIGQIGVNLTWFSIPKDTNATYEFNVTGDDTHGVLRAYNSGEQNVTLFSAVNYGSCNPNVDFIINDANWKARGTGGGKENFVHSKDFSNKDYRPLLRIETNSCAYNSGNWNIDCFDNCTIKDNIIIDNQGNISITGTGSLLVNGGNITGYNDVTVKGDSGTNRCEVICINSPYCFG